MILTLCAVLAVAPAAALTSTMFPETLVSQLSAFAAGTPYLVIDDFITEQLRRELRDDALSIHSKGHFKTAGTGEGVGDRVVDEIRRCAQCFIIPDRSLAGKGGNDLPRRELCSILLSLHVCLPALTTPWFGQQ